MTSLFVYILRGTSPFFSSVSCHLPFGNHAKTNIFPHNILITFAADVQRSALHIAFQARRSLSCYSSLFGLYRTLEGSCSCTRFGTCEPLRHSTCLLLLCSSCPKFKFGTKVLIYIKVHKTALNDCLLWGFWRALNSFT